MRVSLPSEPPNESMMLHVRRILAYNRSIQAMTMIPCLGELTACPTPRRGTTLNVKRTRKMQKSTGPGPSLLALKKFRIEWELDDRLRVLECGTVCMDTRIGDDARCGVGIESDIPATEVVNQRAILGTKSSEEFRPSLACGPFTSSKFP